MEERYFEIKEKNEKTHLINFPTILKLTGKNLEIITSKHQGELKKIGFNNDEKGNYFVNTHYSIKEISKERAEKIIKQRDFEWKSWGDYMTNSSDTPSPHLTGQNTEALQ